MPTHILLPKFHFATPIMSSYKLYYFDARGVAEPIRLLFAYANVKFEEVRFTRGPEWAKLKPQMPWNVVPVLEVDGEQISQSRAIYRFLAKRFKLVPADDFQVANCEEYIEAIVDLRTEGKKFHREADPQAKSALQEQFLSGQFTRYMAKFTDILKKSGTNGYLVGDKLTYADIFVAYTIEQIASWTNNPQLLDSYPEIKKHVNVVMNLPGIKEWIAVRPKTAS